MLLLRNQKNKKLYSYEAAGYSGCLIVFTRRSSFRFFRNGLRRVAYHGGTAGGSSEKMSCAYNAVCFAYLFRVFPRIELPRNEILRGVKKMDRKMTAERPLKILKGFLAAWILTAAGIIGSGFVMLLTPVGIEGGSYIIIGAASAGGFLCGAAASSAVGRRGLVVGLMTGVILSLTILLVYLLFFGTTANSSLNYLPLAFPVASAGVGGIFGVSRTHSFSGQKKNGK